MIPSHLWIILWESLFHGKRNWAFKNQINLPESLGQPPEELCLNPGHAGLLCPPSPLSPLPCSSFFTMVFLRNKNHSHHMHYHLQVTTSKLSAKLIIYLSSYLLAPPSAPWAIPTYHHTPPPQPAHPGILTLGKVILPFNVALKSSAIFDSVPP